MRFTGVGVKLKRKEFMSFSMYDTVATEAIAKGRRVKMQISAGGNGFLRGCRWLVTTSNFKENSFKTCRSFSLSIK